MKNRDRLFEIGLFASVLVLHAAIAFAPQETLLRWFRSDDAFYYFKTAQNIAEGYGSTFDRIAPTNGYHPLWLVVCVPIFALARIDLWIPLRLVVVVAGALTAGGSILWFRLVSSVASKPLGVVVAVFWSLWPLAHATTTQLGLENALNAFLFVLALHVVSRLPEGRPPSSRQAWGAALALTLLVFARLDNIFVAAFLGLWITLAGSPYRTRIVLTMAVVIFGVVAAVLVRVGPARVLGFKDAVTMALGLSLVLQLPCLILLPKHNSPRGRVRLTSLLAASGAGAGLLWLAVVVARAVGLPVFPHLAVIYEWAVVTLLLVLLEVYLGRVGAARPDQGAREAVGAALRRGAGAAVVIFGVLGVSLAAYFVVNQLVFGTPVPVSGQVKEWWGTIYSAYGRPATSALGFLGLDPAREAAPVAFLVQVAAFFQDAIVSRGSPVLLLGWTIASLFLLRSLAARRLVRQTALVPLGMANMTVVLYYGVRGYQNPGEWYWVGIVVFTILGFSAFLAPAFRWLAAVKSRWRLDRIAAGILVVGIGFRAAQYFPQRFLRPSATVPTTSGANGFLEAHTEPGARIGIPGSGGVGYFMEGRTVVNLDGLAGPFEYLRLSRIGQGAAYLEAIGLDYVYASPGMLRQTEPYKTTFEGRLEVVAENESQTLFRFVASAGK